MTNNKPKAPLIGSDGNIFNLLGIASNVLRRNNLHHKVTEMVEKVTSSQSYDEALSKIMEYVEPVDQDEYFNQEFENLDFK